MKLSANEPIDAIELRWGQCTRSPAVDAVRLADLSGRTTQEWEAALAAGTAPFPSDFIIRERFAVVAAGVIAGLTAEDIAPLARAPRTWCAEAIRRLHEPTGLHERPTPELTRPTRARLAPPILTDERPQP